MKFGQNLLSVNFLCWAHLTMLNLNILFLFILRLLHLSLILYRISQRHDYIFRQLLLAFLLFKHVWSTGIRVL